MKIAEDKSMNLQDITGHGNNPFMKNKGQKPLVSVIIPTFNRGWILGEAVQSVIDQTYRPLEIIVVDDGSTDDTQKLLHTFDRQIEVIFQENKGVSAARNTGIRRSRGDLIALLDSDDLWTPDKIQRQVTFFNDHPDAMICQTQEIWVRNGRRVNPKNKHAKQGGMIFESSLELCLVSPSAVMMRPALFDLKGYFDERLPACEDYDLWLRVSATHPIHLMEQACTIKRGGHEDQLSRQHSLDRYRIDAIERLLGTDILTMEQRRSAKEVFRKKTVIYGQGCIKRGKKNLGDHYLAKGKPEFLGV